jgi:hypothetical protein
VYIVCCILEKGLFLLFFFFQEHKGCHPFILSHALPNEDLRDKSELSRGGYVMNG